MERILKSGDMTLIGEKKEILVNRLCLALGIAALPPLWAVVSPYIGITTGAVALICAGVYVANGNKRKDVFRILAGFLLGDLWAVLAIAIMGLLNLQPDLELYGTLFVLGGLAVLIGDAFPRFLFLPSWLCGWAVGLTVMGPLEWEKIGTIPFQIGAAMIAGVVYVGVGVDAFQKWLSGRILKR